MAHNQSKKCSRCGMTKTLSEFRNAKNGKYGVRSICKDCEKLYRLAHKEERSTKEKKRRRAYSLINKTAVQEASGDKRCNVCGEEKPLHEFHKDCTRVDGFCYICKKCQREIHKRYYRSHIDELREKRVAQKDKRAAYDKEYYKKNKNHKLERDKQRRKKHPEIKQTYNKKYWRENKEKLLAQAKLYNRRRKQSDPVYRLKIQIRSSIRASFERKNVKKSSPSEAILGCSIEEFQKYLKQTWKKRYGYDWTGQPCHIDHITPLAVASTEQEVIALCHYTNLQLLTPEDNLRKRATYEQ